MYTQVDKKKTQLPYSHNPKPPKEECRVEDASIVYQPKDAAEKSQQAADTTPKKTKKKFIDVGTHVRSGDHLSCQ